MPRPEREVDFDVLPRPDRDTEATRTPVEPIRLVLRLQHQALHVRLGGGLPLAHASSTGLQTAQGDLEGRRDVLLVDRVVTAQVRVGGPGEAHPGTEIPPEGHADGLVHDEAELLQQPFQTGVLPLNVEYDGLVGAHAVG